jgi:hypothetical protein
VSAPTEHRKLAAIMFTDTAGFSALARRNETLARGVLAEHRRVVREGKLRVTPARRCRPR